MAWGFLQEVAVGSSQNRLVLCCLPLSYNRELIPRGPTDASETVEVLCENPLFGSLER